MQDTLYDSLDNITIWVFTEILNKGDYSLLGKHKDPWAVWLELYNDYAIQSKLDTNNLKQLAKVDALEKKHKYIIGSLEILRSSHYLREVEGFEELRQIAIDKLRSKGYLFNDSKVFEDEMKRLEWQTENLKMKIHIEEQKIEKTDKKVAINIWKELAGLQRITDIKLNPKTDVMAQLIATRELANEITQQRKAS